MKQITKEQHLLNVLKENLKRVNNIFNAVDFGKVNMTNELINDMNDFFVISKDPFADFKES